MFASQGQFAKAFPARCLLIACVACLVTAADAPASDVSKESRSRQPIALALSTDGSKLFAANRRSGSLSVIDAKAGRVVAEHDIGKSLADLAPLPDGRLLALDRDANALLVLKVGKGEVAVEARIAVEADPASLRVSADGSTCVVASTGSRKLSVVTLNPLKLTRTIDLPFSPRLMTWAASKLVAADAFGGRIAVVDPGRDEPDSIRSIPAHNIRGLATSPDGQSIVVAHQTLNKLARSTFEDVHWGSLVGNHLRFLKLDALLDPKADILQGARLVDLGRTGEAAGDPGAITFDARDRIIVALTGVHEVAVLVSPRSASARRVAVGQGPTALQLAPDGKHVYVASAFNDSITIVDAVTARKLDTISLGERPDPTPIERGERLFADARLSHDGWMSCQSCHTDGQSNGLTADTLSDNSFGAPKRVTSLLGVGSTAPWTWLGKTDRLEDQVRKSIETTMRGPKPTPTQVEDLTAYLRSLPPPRPSPIDPGEAASRGQEIFRARKCAECHAPPEYTAEGTFDVGLKDEAGNRKFNPPSLRGVGQRAPYLHDGRATTLPDVFLRHRHPREASWSDKEVEDLVAFLKTL